MGRAARRAERERDGMPLNAAVLSITPLGARA